VGERGGVSACGAVQVVAGELGEVRGRAGGPEYGNRGLGRQLVRGIEREASDIGLSRLMALTCEVGFFHRLGFCTVELRELPEKVWGVCINCPKFRRCDETAVLKHLSQP